MVAESADLCTYRESQHRIEKNGWRIRMLIDTGAARAVVGKKWMQNWPPSVVIVEFRVLDSAHAKKYRDRGKSRHRPRSRQIQLAADKCFRRLYKLKSPTQTRLFRSRKIRFSIRMWRLIGNHTFWNYQGKLRRN